MKARLTRNRERQKYPTSKYEYTEKEPVSFVGLWVEKRCRYPRWSVGSEGHNVGRGILKNALLVTKVFMLAAVDSVDDIGARSLCTNLLDFVQDCKFDRQKTSSKW